MHDSLKYLFYFVKVMRMYDVKDYNKWKLIMISQYMQYKLDRLLVTSTDCKWSYVTFNKSGFVLLKRFVKVFLKVTIVPDDLEMLLDAGHSYVETTWFPSWSLVIEVLNRTGVER